MWSTSNVLVATGKQRTSMVADIILSPPVLLSSSLGSCVVVVGFPTSIAHSQFHQCSKAAGHSARRTTRLSFCLLSFPSFPSSIRGRLLLRLFKLSNSRTRLDHCSHVWSRLNLFTVRHRWSERPEPTSFTRKWRRQEQVKAYSVFQHVPCY